MDAADLGRVIGEVLDAASSRAGADDTITATLSELGIDDADRTGILARVQRHRDELTRLRRREHELAALFSSARELAEVRDIDALLARLVTRAHEMMGTDVTYLSEFDIATRELHVRKTVGSVTPQFQKLRVPAGMGLASQVADTRAALWVPRYSQYLEGIHEHTIDDAVSAEGIISILGVPMLSEGRVLGVLFAATRQEHEFTPEEIAVLSALADHASVVLQTANNLAQLRSSEDEARAALDTLTDHVETRDRSNVVHQELVHAVLLGGGFPQVADTLATALGRTVTILDAESFPVASSSDDPGTTAVTLPPAVRDAVTTSRSSGHCCRVHGDPSVEVVAAVTAGELFFGAVLLSAGELELGPVDERTIERAAQVAALLVLQHNAVADADRRTRGDLISDLLDASPERRRDLDRRARARRVVLTDLTTVLVVVVEPERRSAVERATASYFDGRGIVGEHEGTIAAAVPSADPLATARALHAHLVAGADDPVLVVATPSASSIDDFSGRFDTGHRTARLLDALGVEDGAVGTQAYAPYMVMFGSDPEALHAFIDQTIGPVVQYDAVHRTDLVSTLRAFVRNDASPTKTARALSYHTNTILQRLERLKSLLGEDWRQDEILFRISTAVRLDELRAVARRRPRD
ncbi:GAF domain-containing protein [Rhodococcus sp. 14-2470-1b]|uniref:helix-turn-helix domain-containing protein n=1 Tax=Rhodococcus sp. 14-2470-1b TaxID=2023149 RepID=UPI000B9B8B15|nr:GAF domain-containing protein [Rhodococcus sp. 14-2470-1b]OZF52149.1 GAF domain-containing protein [Rhodococcus sp. 14-2470-1b]